MPVGIRQEILNVLPEVGSLPPILDVGAGDCRKHVAGNLAGLDTDVLIAVAVEHLDDIWIVRRFRPRQCAVNTGGIEHKMGIKGQATCVLNFDDAVAWRLGPKPEPLKPGEKRSSSAGMAGMFGMMNAARLGVGIQGIGLGEVAYQNGSAYAHERRVGRALTGAKEPDKSADLEIVHPDVKKMLLQARSFVEGMRALAAWTTLQMSVAQSTRPEAETAGLLADLMTPVIKAFGTDMGFEAANLGMQCWGCSGCWPAGSRRMKRTTA